MQRAKPNHKTPDSQHWTSRAQQREFTWKSTFSHGPETIDAHKKASRAQCPRHTAIYTQNTLALTGVRLLFVAHSSKKTTLYGSDGVVASGQQRVKIRCVSWAVNQYTHGSAHNQQSLGAIAEPPWKILLSGSHLSARVPVIVQVNVAKSYYHAVASNLYQRTTLRRAYTTPHYKYL
jgi:hypothetical protein